MEEKYYVTETESGKRVIGIVNSNYTFEDEAAVCSKLNELHTTIKRQAEWIEANKNKAKNAAIKQNEQGKQIQALKQAVKDLRKYPESLRRKIPQVLANAFEELGTYDVVREDGTYILSIGSAELDKIFEHIKHVR